MVHPAGESDDGSLRVGSDRRLRLEFHGSRITSDAGLLAYEDVNDADRLAHDPAMRAVVDRSGLDRAAAAYRAILPVLWRDPRLRPEQIVDAVRAWRTTMPAEFRFLLVDH